MKKRLLYTLLALPLIIILSLTSVKANENHRIQLDEKLSITVQPSETLSISFDLRNDERYTGEDCVIILTSNSDMSGLSIVECDGGILYSNSGYKSYVQFKGLPVGTISIKNRYQSEIQSCNVMFSEVVPVENFTLGVSPENTNGIYGWAGKAVGGDQYIDDARVGEYCNLCPIITPVNHEDCYVTEWTSSNENVVDSVNGILVLQQPGTTTITALLSNGMSATYDFVVVNPEKLYSGYSKTFLVSPGEYCLFSFMPEQTGEYILSCSVSIPDCNTDEYVEYFDFYSMLPDHADGEDEYCCRINNVLTDRLICKPGDNPYSFYCSNYMPFYDGKPVETPAIALTVCFDKYSPFTDVNSSDYYYTPVLWALEKGITSGTSDTAFSPYDSCLRSQVVTFLWRAAGKPLPKSQDNPFVDVKPTDYYYNAVLWAVENGITYGADDTHFEPNGVCNRSQAVTFLYRAFKKPPVGSANNPFEDVSTGDWYASAVSWAVQEGIAYGTSETAFSPNDVCNRSQVVTFLYRAYN